MGYSFYLEYIVLYSLLITVMMFVRETLSGFLPFNIPDFIYISIAIIPNILLLLWSLKDEVREFIEARREKKVKEKRESVMREIVSKDCSAWLLEIARDSKMWEHEYSDYRFNSSVIHKTFIELETYGQMSMFKSRFREELDARNKMALIVTFAIKSSHDSLLNSPSSYLIYYDMSLTRLYALHYELCVREGMSERKFWGGLEDIVNEIWEEAKLAYTKNYKRGNGIEIEDDFILEQTLKRSAKAGYEDIKDMKNARNNYFGK